MSAGALAVALLSLASVVGPEDARADGSLGGAPSFHVRPGGHSGYDRPGREYEGRAFRYGFDRGWREGSEGGRRDGRRARDPRYWREREFREADRGYKPWMGPRGDYATGFREGYRAGYRRAYAAARPTWRGRWERYGWSDERWR